MNVCRNSILSTLSEATLLFKVVDKANVGFLTKKQFIDVSGRPLVLLTYFI